MEKISFRGKDYPVEVNMRVIDAYLRSTTGDSIASLERSYPADLLLLLFLAMTEGAALNNTELDITADDLVSLHFQEYNALMDEFLPVLREQLSPKLAVNGGNDGKKKAMTP